MFKNNNREYHIKVLSFARRPLIMKKKSCVVPSTNHQVH